MTPADVKAMTDGELNAWIVVNVEGWGWATTWAGDGKTKDGQICDVPAYTTDLNAIYAASLKLNPDQFFLYMRQLAEMFADGQMEEFVDTLLCQMLRGRPAHLATGVTGTAVGVLATARQKAEALVLAVIENRKGVE